MGKGRLRALLLAVTLFGLLALAGPGTSSAAAACKQAAKPAYELPNKKARKATLCLLNKQRASRGLRKLKEDKGLRKAAKKHTKLMIKRRCFLHQCPGESDLIKRIEATSYLPCKRCNWGVGEILAFGFGSKSSPKEIVKAWMNSSRHRAHILTRSFESIGIGIKPGVPKGSGRGASYTTNFGFKN